VIDLLDDESLPADQTGLEAEIAEVERRMEACRAEARALMASEDPQAGIFHARAIHESKQRHMMLRYQKDLRVARLNRLRSSG
jgi:hypothetical protein